MPPAEEGAELGYSSWCTPPGEPRLPSPSLVATQRGNACGNPADQRLVTASDPQVPGYRSGFSAISGRLFSTSVDCFLQDRPSQPSDGTVCALRTGLSAGCQQCFDELVKCVLVETNCLQHCFSGVQTGSLFTTTPECKQCMDEVGCLAMLDDCAGTTASIDAAASRNNDLCAAGTDEINRACPHDGAEAAARPAGFGGIPNVCTEQCAAAFVPWWDQCVSSAIGLEVERQLGREQLTGFYRTCLRRDAGDSTTIGGEASTTTHVGH